MTARRSNISSRLIRIPYAAALAKSVPGSPSLALCNAVPPWWITSEHITPKSAWRLPTGQVWRLLRRAGLQQKPCCTSAIRKPKAPWAAGDLQTGGLSLRSPGDVYLLNFLSSRNLHLSCDLSIAFPVGDLVGDQRIIFGRLDIARIINGPRGDGVLARCGISPVQ